MRLALALLLALVACQRVAPGPEVQAPQARVEPVPLPANPVSEPLLAYEERWTGGAEPGDAVPTVVAVHGLGDAPEHFAWVVDGWRTPARVVLPRAPTPFGRGFAWMTIRTTEGKDEALSLQLAHAASRVATLCDALASADENATKPVVTGFSQGGMIAYAVAVRHPESVAGAVPVSGFLPEPLWPAAGSATATVRALHGDADAVIDVSAARSTVAGLKELGADAELEVFPRVGHVIPPPVRARMEARVVELAGPR